MKQLQQNRTRHAIVFNMLLAAVSLFVNGFGVYLTIHADIGAGPWDVLSIGVSKTFHILYGTASISISIAILLIDIVMREPIGIAMFIDAVTVGKAVDFFNWADFIPKPQTMWGGILMILAGIFVIGYTQYTYMYAALGCGPRDTLIVGLSRHLKRIPIGVISIVVLSLSTLIGWLLGGPVGVGTLICAFCSGPIMQFAFFTVRFDATKIRHQQLLESVRVFLGKPIKA